MTTMKIFALELNIEYGGPDTMRESELPSAFSCAVPVVISGSLDAVSCEIDRIGSMLPIFLSMMELVLEYSAVMILVVSSGFSRI